MYIRKAFHSFYWSDTAVVFDLETSILNREPNNPVGKMKSSPFHPMNKIELVCWSTPSVLSTLAVIDDVMDFRKNIRVNCLWNPAISGFLRALRETKLLIGQNLKFDLLYLMMHHYDDIMDFFRRGGYIWDTMQAEYLLTNQQEKFAGLGNKYKVVIPPTGGKPIKTLLKQGMSEKYGGVDKDSRIKEYWDADVDTADIPKDQLLEYCEADIQNTLIVAVEQIELTNKRGSAFRALVQTQMQAIVATTMMEYNGMKFDIDVAAIEAKKIEIKVNHMRDCLVKYMQSEFETFNSTGHPVIRKDINPGSVKQLNLVLFGGEYQWTTALPQYDTDTGDPILYKSGPHKGTQKNKIGLLSTDTIIPSAGASFALAITDQLNKTIHGFTIDDDAIQRVILPAHKAAKTSVVPFLVRLLEYRSMSKDLTTYYLSLMELMWGTDGCIHGSLNHCSTSTGRLSSSSPNMQNLAG